MKRISIAFILTLVLSAAASAQQAEITISLNEQFFDSLLDAIYKNAAPPEFSLSKADAKTIWQPARLSNGFWQTGPAGGVCSDSIKLLRESNSVRTAVRFREGKIYAPIAFSGSYSPPFVGCVDFSGYAETNIELEFDPRAQRLVGRATVLNVALDGTGGLGGNVLARMVQSSLDKKFNPIEILRLEKLSFLLPIQNAQSIRMRATGFRHEITNGVLNIHVGYEFAKA